MALRGGLMTVSVTKVDRGFWARGVRAEGTRRAGMVATVFALGFSVVPWFGSPAALASEPCLRGKSLTVTLNGVPRRDTLSVTTGGEIRLAELDLPNPAIAPDPGIGDLQREVKTWLEALVGGTPSAAFYPIRQDADRFGRLEGHLVLKSPSRTPWLQAALVEKGYARVVPESGRKDCLDKLLDLEAKARDQRLGLWRMPSYAARSASQAPQFLYSYQLVKDRISGVETGDGRPRLELVPGAKKGLTLVLYADAVREIEERTGRPLETLKGRSIQVRGWIEEGREGMEMAVEHSAQLRLLF